VKKPPSGGFFFSSSLRRGGGSSNQHAEAAKVTQKPQKDIHESFCGFGFRFAAFALNLLVILSGQGKTPYSSPF
jgi:hypothetical protein